MNNPLQRMVGKFVYHRKFSIMSTNLL